MSKMIIHLYCKIINSFWVRIFLLTANTFAAISRRQEILFYRFRPFCIHPKQPEMAS